MTDQQIYQQLMDGVRFDKIQKGLKGDWRKRYYKMRTILRDKALQNKQQDLKFGRRSEPYYESEDDYGVTPQYSYEELSLNEKEFYETRATNR